MARGKPITWWDGVNAPEFFKDFLGQEIRVGDYIVYSTVSGHSSTLSLAQVDSFPTNYANGNPYTERYWDGNTQRTARIFCVRVQPVLDAGWKSRYSKDEKTGLPKKVVLQVFDKIVKVPAEFGELAEAIPKKKNWWD